MEEILLLEEITAFSYNNITLFRKSYSLKFSLFMHI